MPVYAALSGLAPPLPLSPLLTTKVCCACVVTEHLSELVTLRSADDAAWLQVKLCYLRGYLRRRPVRDLL